MKDFELPEIPGHILMVDPGGMREYARTAIAAYAKMEAEAWAELTRLRAERGPADGQYATWKEAAAAERQQRVRLQQILNVTQMEFDHWLDVHGFDTQKGADGDYVNIDSAMAYEAYLLGRSSK